jgi:pyridoxine 5-phosphate synthase
MMLLGVNIDHIAVLREARKINDPDPLDAISLAARAGANQITIHLREDRRHINDYDTKRVIENSPLPVNLECSVNPDIIEIVAELKPHRATFVPEKREEVTTEGGISFDNANYANLDKAIHFLKAREIETSLFIDPTIEAIRAAKGLGVEWVELHTGLYANIHAMLYTNLRYTPHSIKELDLERSKLQKMLQNSIQTLSQTADEAEDYGLKVAAGHGLNYQNVEAIAKIDNIRELNIGQSIIARSVFSGFEKALIEMIALIK